MDLSIRRLYVKNGIETLKSDSFILDTNIFIYYLNDRHEVEKFFTEEFILNNNLYYSIITEIELLSFPRLTEDESGVIRELLKKFLPISITEDIKEKTIEIKRNTNIGIADSIIAASSIVLDAALVTRDEPDFARVKEISLINPFS